MKSDTTKIYFSVSHPDPKQVKKGVEALRGFAKAISTLTGEPITIEVVEPDSTPPATDERKE